MALRPFRLSHLHRDGRDLRRARSSRRDPFTAGHSRTAWDVGVHSAILVLVVLVAAPGVESAQLQRVLPGATCSTLLGWQFGDAHLHNEHLLRAVQERCEFAPGEVVVAWIESQPIHKNTQEYKVIDLALGVVERGSYRVQDAVDAQPWLPDGPIPFDVEWSMQDETRIHLPSARREPDVVAAPGTPDDAPPVRA